MRSYALSWLDNVSDIVINYNVYNIDIVIFVQWIWTKKYKRLIALFLLWKTLYQFKIM